jgi:hypothetical protein
METNETATGRNNAVTEIIKTLVQSLDAVLLGVCEIGQVMAATILSS